MMSCFYFIFYLLMLAPIFDRMTLGARLDKDFLSSLCVSHYGSCCSLVGGKM